MRAALLVSGTFLVSTALEAAAPPARGITARVRLLIERDADEEAVRLAAEQPIRDREYIEEQRAGVIPAVARIRPDKRRV